MLGAPRTNTLKLTTSGEFGGLDISSETQEKLSNFLRLLSDWQQRINLIGPANEQQIWVRHVLDSLQLLPLMKNEGSVVDLGSGAGFPGLVIAIASGRPVSLYESHGKKAAFLREAARLAGVSVYVHCERIEKAAPQHQQVPAYVTARALAPLAQLLSLAQPWLTSGSTGLFHKGQDYEDELTEAAKSWKMDVIRHPSRTDARGVILEIKGLEHV